MHRKAEKKEIHIRFSFASRSPAEELSLRSTKRVQFKLKANSDLGETNGHTNGRTRTATRPSFMSSFHQFPHLDFTCSLLDQLVLPSFLPSVRPSSAVLSVPTPGPCTAMSYANAHALHVAGLPSFM